MKKNIYKIGKELFISSDEEIKRDWVCDIELNRVEKCQHSGTFRNWKKIILTTDQDLINDGVQSIDNEFLKWFVKNPSCEWVEVEKYHGIKTSIAEISAVSGRDDYNWKGRGDFRDYKIIIPQEEPNPFQLPETLPDDIFFKSLEKEYKNDSKYRENHPTKCKCCNREKDLRFGVCFDCTNAESIIVEGVDIWDNEIPKQHDLSTALSKLQHILTLYEVVKKNK